MKISTYLCKFLLILLSFCGLVHHAPLQARATDSTAAGTNTAVQHDAAASQKEAAAATPVHKHIDLAKITGPYTIKEFGSFFEVSHVYLGESEEARCVVALANALNDPKKYDDAAVLSILARMGNIVHPRTKITYQLLKIVYFVQTSAFCKVTFVNFALQRQRSGVVVDALIKKGASIAGVRGRANSALYEAIISENTEAFTAVLAYLNDADERLFEDGPLLNVAAKVKDPKKRNFFIAELLKKKADAHIDFKSNKPTYKEIALATAYEHDEQLEIIKWLEAGARPECHIRFPKRDYSEGPLSFLVASIRDNKYMNLTFFLGFCKKPLRELESPSEHGIYSMTEAANREDAETRERYFKLLTERGADTKLKDSEGRTYREWGLNAALGNIQETAQVDRWITAGANPLLPMPHTHQTFIERAIINLAAMINPKFKDYVVHTKEDIERREELLNKYFAAIPTQPHSADQQTALNIAVICAMHLPDTKACEVITTLQKHGANISSERQLPISMQTFYRPYHIVGTPLHEAARKRRNVVLRHLITHKADLYKEDVFGWKENVFAVATGKETRTQLIEAHINNKDIFVHLFSNLDSKAVNMCLQYCGLPLFEGITLDEAVLQVDEDDVRTLLKNPPTKEPHILEWDANAAFQRILLAKRMYKSALTEEEETKIKTMLLEIYKHRVVAQELLQEAKKMNIDVRDMLSSEYHTRLASYATPPTNTALLK